MSELPQINWVKNDPAKYNYFQDGSRFLVALQVTNNKINLTHWEFDVIQINADGESMYLEYPNGEPYDCWNFNDFEYFTLLEGEMPTREQYDD